MGASRSASAAGRASGEIIKEEDEDEIEEVDVFSPAAPEAEETIWEGSKEDAETDGCKRSFEVIPTQSVQIFELQDMSWEH